MRGRQALLGLAIACAAAFGCAEFQDERQPAWFRRLTPGWTAAPVGGQIDLAMVEESRPSHYLSEAIWRETDELAVPLELRPKLEANGLRVGLVNGAGSAKLLKLLTRPESCPIARRLTGTADQESLWPLRQGVASADFECVRQGEAVKIEAKDAEFGLALRLRTEGAKTLVRFEPYVKHAEAERRLMSPSAGGSGWSWEGAKPAELRLPELAWQVALGPTDYLVVGGRFDRPTRLGALAFTDEVKNVQRALVIRGVGRLETAGIGPHGPAPLAVQALGGGPEVMPRGQ